MIPRLEIHFNHVERKWFWHGTAYDMLEGEYWLNHCRSGLQLALQALQLKSKIGVGMMVYNCNTVMNSIYQAGCTPVFVDITDRMTIDMEDLARKRSQMKVLIVTHLFGITNDIKAIKTLYPDLIIIEDCAHCFGHNIEGEMGVYSIGQGKFPSIGDGGILIVNSESTIPNLRTKIDSLYNTLPEYSRLGEWKLFLRLFVNAWMYKPWIYEHITKRLKDNMVFGKGDIKKHTVLLKMSGGIAKLLVQSKREYAKMMTDRLANAQVMIERMKNLTNDGLVGENGFMLVVHTNDVARLKAQFAAKGIETETHFARCIDWAMEFGYKLGSCPKTEKIINELLMVPTYQKIDN